MFYALACLSDYVRLTVTAPDIPTRDADLALRSPTLYTVVGAWITQSFIHHRPHRQNPLPNSLQSPPPLRRALPCTRPSYLERSYERTVGSICASATGATLLP